MARYRGPVDKLSRREGINLFLKGDRSFGDKAAIERKPYPPGQHGQLRQKLSEYATQLREKQKIKRFYGVLERQFRHTFRHAEKQKGVTGQNLIKLLEARLDNMVYRSGLARSRPEARMWVTHRHFQINGKTVNIPSYQVKAGDVISLREKDRQSPYFKDAIESAGRRGVPEWIELDVSKCEAKVRVIPERGQITWPMNEHLVVELYSK